MVYPRNNFATDAKYWGREVEKKITNLESSLQSSDINNTTRDSQLSVTSNQALIAANDAKAAAQSTADIINNIYSAGTTEINGGVIKSGTITANEISANYVYAGTISANQVSAGSINGLNITGGTLATSGSQHVEVSGSSAKFFDLGGSQNGAITATGSGGSSQLFVGTANSQLLLGNGLLELNSNGTVEVNGGNGMSVAQNLTVGSFTNNGSYGSINVSGIINSGGYGGNGFPSVASNTVSGTTTFAPNVFISGSGNMARNTTASERRAKESIEQLEFDTEAFIAINPVKFNYKREAVSDDSQAEAVNLGFILDDFEDAGIDEFLVAAPQEGDEYKQLRYQILYMYLHKVVQTQNETIKTLEARLDALEAE